MTKIIYGLVGVVLGIAMTSAVFVWRAHTNHTQMMAMSDVKMSDMGATHQHPLRPVSLDLPVPSVTHLVFPDAVDGYNIQILPRNFKFTPASINRAPVANEGHAHIYVNGIKIARVYAPWYHLPASLLQSGDNQVRVTLNANDHGEWAINENAIASNVRVIKPE